MKISQALWFLLRVAITGDILYTILENEPRSNVDWLACGLISTVSAIFLFGWLHAVRSQWHETERPYSLTTPFFPVGRLTIRFWFTAALSQLIAGALASVYDLHRYGTINPLSASFFFLGVFCLVAVLVSIRSTSLPPSSLRRQ